MLSILFKNDSTCHFAFYIFLPCSTVQTALFLISSLFSQISLKNIYRYWEHMKYWIFPFLDGKSIIHVFLLVLCGPCMIFMYLINFHRIWWTKLYFIYINQNNPSRSRSFLQCFFSMKQFGVDVFSHQFFPFFPNILIRLMSTNHSERNIILLLDRTIGIILSSILTIGL